MNWKDIKNPKHGGAEIYTHEIAKRLAKKGFDITIFSSKFEGCADYEAIDNVKIARGGNKLTIYLKEFIYYMKNKEEFDFVIDEINTIPFFTPLYVKKPKIVLIHQLAKEIWEYSTKWPFNLLGRFFEPIYLKLYKNERIITVSDSVKEELLQFGFKNISIVLNGIDENPLKDTPQKNTEPTMVYLGRVIESKRPEHVIYAFNKLKEEIKDLQLWIIGDGGGYYKNLVERYRNSKIMFFGRVDNKKKHKLLGKAHVLVVPSVKEGWGRVVIEANSVGTPAVGYKVTGLIDSIKDGETGLLVKNGDINELTEACKKILTDKNVRMKLSNNAKKWSKNFSWDKSAELFLTNISK